MISWSKIDLREYTCTTKLIEQIINPRQRVLVLDGNLIQGTIIHAQLWVPSFFMTKIIGAPHTDELGWINHFSSNSLMCSFNSANSGVAILYGVLYINVVPGLNSITNSMSQSGGIPGNSSGKTLENSLTTSTSDP
jgi:hypothetical protein